MTLFDLLRASLTVLKFIAFNSRPVGKVVIRVVNINVLRLFMRAHSSGYSEISSTKINVVY